MEDKVFDEKALILGVHKCLTEWLKGHAYVCCDSQKLVDAWTSFHTKDETTLKMFYWFHQHGRLEQSLNFEIQTVVNRMTVSETPHEMAEYEFPSMDVIDQFLQSWCKNRIISLKKTIDDKQKMMMSWSAFDLYDNQILKAYAKAFASGNIADVAKFEKQIFVSSQFRLEESDIKLQNSLKTDVEIPPLRSIVDKFVGEIDDIEKQLFDSEVGEISDDDVKKLFSDFLTKMEKKNEQLKAYFQPDDVIRLREEEIKMKPATSPSKPAVPKVVPIQFCDKALQIGKNKETVQNPMTEQNVDACQNRTYSEVAKVGIKGENEAEEKIPAARSPNAGKRRSNFQLPTEGSAKIPKVDEWVKAKKVFTVELDPSRVREAFDIAKYMAEPLKEEDVVKEETGVTSKPIATIKVGLTPQEMKAANIEKKNLEKSEKQKKENEENEAFESAEIENSNSRQEQTRTNHVTRFNTKLEEFKRTSQNLTDDLAKRIATRFIEKRIEVLSENVKNDEDNTQHDLILHCYKLMQTMGSDFLDRVQFEQLCMLNTNYKENMFSDLEVVFLTNQELDNKLGVRLIDAKKRMADDPVAARRVFDTFHFRYISITDCSKRDVNRTNAKLYLDSRISTLSETGEGSSNDSSKLEIYQAVSAMDFDTIPLEKLQQMSMMKMLIQEPSFSILEPILVESLKSIQ